MSLRFRRLIFLAERRQRLANNGETQSRKTSRRPRQIGRERFGVAGRDAWQVGRLTAVWREEQNSCVLKQTRLTCRLIRTWPPDRPKG